MNKKTSPGWLAVCLASFSAIFFMGCGGSEWPPTYKSTGTVTLDGSPVERASITFHPRDGQNPANGTTDANGIYELSSFNADDGAAPGLYGVSIQKFPAIQVDSAPGGMPFDESMNTDAPPDPSLDADPKNELPEKYSSPEESELSATVSADGGNVFNFELTSE